MGAASGAALFAGGGGAVELGGEVWAVGVAAASVWDPGGADTAVPAPVGVEDIVFGLKGSDTVADWFGILRGTGATSHAHRAYVDRDASDNVLVFFEIRGDDVEIVAANGSTLATVSPTPNGSSINCVSFMLSPDGNTLLWGPKEYAVAASPVPDALASFSAYGMAISGDDIVLSIIASPYLVDDTVWDLDDGVTEETPKNNDPVGVRLYQIIVRVRASDGVTLSSTQHSQLDNKNTANWAPQSAQGNDPVFNGGNPSIANGRYALAEKHWGDPNVLSAFRLAESSPGILAPALNTQSPTAGFYVSALSDHDPLYWITGGHDAGNAGPTGYSPMVQMDDAGALWWSVTTQSSDATRNWERAPTVLSARLVLLSGALHITSHDAAGNLLWQRHSTNGGASNSYPHGLFLTPDGASIIQLAKLTSGNDLIVNAGQGDAVTLLGVNGSTLVVISREATTGALQWAKKIQTYSGASGNTGSGGSLYSARNLSFNLVSSTLRIGVCVDFSTFTNRLIAGAGLGVGEVTYTNDTASGDLEERLMDVVLDLATGVAQSIGQILEGTDLAMGNINDVHLDLRAK